MIHVVFQEADREVLKKSFELDPSLGAEVFVIKDDYAVGPLKNIHEPEGILERKDWWKKVLEGTDQESKVDSGEVNDAKTLSEITGLLANEQETLWIWAAQNKHDVSGYYWLISQLKPYQGRVFILFLNNLPFINAKGNIFYPTWIHEIEPREFIKAKKLARPVTLSEFEIDPDEWTKLCNENKMVRYLEGGKKLIQFDEDYYDKEILKYISNDFQKVNKVIHSFITKSVNHTADMFTLWRIKELIAAGKLEVQGVQKNMKDFEVKLKIEAEING